MTASSTSCPGWFPMPDMPVTKGMKHPLPGPPRMGNGLHAPTLKGSDG